MDMEELRRVASRLHCIASQMIDAGHFCPTLERAEIRVKNTGEEIGALVNAINTELARRDAEQAERERLASLLVECDSELSAIAHGRPPSDKDYLKKLSHQCRQASKALKGGSL